MNRSPILEITLRRGAGPAYRLQVDLEMTAVLAVGALATILALRLALLGPGWT